MEQSSIDGAGLFQQDSQAVFCNLARANSSDLLDVFGISSQLPAFILHTANNSLTVPTISFSSALPSSYDH